jgi:4-amino-4-deoxy-L-arabinose transferase-like glycosyltransferase
MTFLKNISQNKQTAFVYLLFVLLVASLIHRLGYQPLYQEEPRRALIALEMIYNDNYIVPTEFGEYYYKKPPVWNWIILGGYKLFGVNEFAVRIFSVLSFISMGLLIYLVCKRYFTRDHAIISSLFFLVSLDLYFYFSLLGEIDIFYALITFASFIAIFHFYEVKKYHLLFILTYTLSAIGFLTKGFPSIIFLILSLLTFFIYKRDVKRLFSFYHLVGIILFMAIIGYYFILYNQYNDSTYYLSQLWSRSSKRTLLQENLINLLQHAYLFPFSILKNILPASVMIIFLFQKKFLNKIRQNKLLEFSFFIFIVNVLVYWISPGTRARYIYMLYPFPIIILAYFYLEYFKSSSSRIKNLFNILIGIFIIALPVVSVSIIFIKDFQFINGLYYYAAVGFIFGGYSLYKYFKSEQFIRILLVVFSFIVLRFLFNLTVIEHRNTYGDSHIQHDHAYEILNKVGNEPVYLYQSTDCSHITIFYLEKEQGRVVSRKNQLEEGLYFIANDYFDLKERDHQVLYEFDDWKDKRSRLIKSL